MRFVVPGDSFIRDSLDRCSDPESEVRGVMQLYNPMEVGRMLNIPTKLVLRYIEIGTLRAISLSETKSGKKKWLVEECDIRAFLDSMKTNVGVEDANN